METGHISEILQVLLRLTKEQTEIIRTEDQSGADENFAARENCLKQLASIPRADRSAQVTPEVRSLLSEIQSLESLNQNLLHEEQDKVGNRLKKNREGQATLRLYDNTNIVVEATYFDTKK